MPLLKIQGQWCMKEQDSGSAGGEGGNSSKYTQNYTQVYFISEIQRKWYTEYPYLSCNIPYTRFKKPLYTVYPKTVYDATKRVEIQSEYLKERQSSKYHE